MDPPFAIVGDWIAAGDPTGGRGTDITTDLTCVADIHLQGGQLQLHERHVIQPHQ